MKHVDIKFDIIIYIYFAKPDQGVLYKKKICTSNITYNKLLIVQLKQKKHCCLTYVVEEQM